MGLTTISDLIIHCLQQLEDSRGAFKHHSLSDITYKLNEMMQLISISTAVHPFKDNVHQEAAIVPILRYMSTHDPENYRFSTPVYVLLFSTLLTAYYM